VVITPCALGVMDQLTDDSKNAAPPPQLFIKQLCVVSLINIMTKTG
jgi:hypothetical protein